jgi:hypothetical protein
MDMNIVSWFLKTSKETQITHPEQVLKQYIKA